MSYRSGGGSPTHHSSYHRPRRAYKPPKIKIAFHHAAPHRGGKVGKTVHGSFSSAPSHSSGSAYSGYTGGTRSSGGSSGGTHAPRHRAPSPKQQAKARMRKQVLHRLRSAAKKSGSLNRAFGPNETVTPHQAALVAEAEGLPGKTYAQIAMGESGLRPGAANPDDGYKSLFQMTPSVQSAATVAKWNKIARKHPGGSTNPIVAGKQAKVLAGGGTGVSNYYGTGFVTDSNAHLPGGQAAARRKLSKPIPKRLKQHAAHVLGKEKTRKVIRKAQRSGGSAEVRPLKGAWGGSERAVLKLIPRSERAEGKNDKRTPAANAATGGAENSDHLTTNKLAYAADIPVNPRVYAKLRQRLGLPAGPTTGNDTVTKNGYRYQLIYGAQYDHSDHIHFGAAWTGNPSSAPGYPGGPTDSAGSTFGAAAVPTSGAQGRAAAPSSRAAPRPRKLTEAEKKRRATIEAIKRSVLDGGGSTAAPAPKSRRVKSSYTAPSRSRNLGL